MSMGTWVASTIRWLWIINTVMSISACVSVFLYTFSSFGCISESGISGSYNSIINFLENQHTVFYKCKTTSYYIATVVHKSPGFFHIPYNTWYFLCLYDNHSNGCELIPHCGFNVVLVLLNIFFMCLLAIHVSSLEKCVFKSSAHWWIRLFICEFRSSLYSEYYNILILS